MSFTAKTRTTVNYALEERTLITKMTPLLKACECTKNLMVGIYLVEKNHFFYCNSKLKEVLGNHHSSLIARGWDFLYAMMDLKEVAVVKDQISNFLSRPCVQNLLTLKYHITDCHGKNILVKHEMLLHRLENYFLAINYFFDITEKEKIEHCFGAFPKYGDSRSTNKNLLSISPRERQVLRLIADGFSSKEIADMLFISNHTAISHRKNLIVKFQVKNTAHLIKKASTVIRL